MANRCEDCIYCDSDYEFDEEIGDDVELIYCRKGCSEYFDYENDVNCPNFKKKKIEEYKEEFTECDKCEFLNECKKTNVCIEVTETQDRFRHYVCGMAGCRKVGN